jgi:hypothetical protein
LLDSQPTDGGGVVTNVPGRAYLPERPLVLIYIKVEPRDTVKLEGLGQLKQ